LIKNVGEKEPRDVASLKLKFKEFKVPNTLRQALESEYREEWWAATMKEYQSHKEKGTFKLMARAALPVDTQTLSGRLVFAAKPDTEGYVKAFKVRYVARGNEQIYDGKTANANMSMVSLKMMVAEAVANGVRPLTSDVSTAYLNSKIDVDTYMEAPPAWPFVPDEDGDYIMKLVKGLYGLKQAGRLWYQTLVEIMRRLGGSRLTFESGVFVRRDPDGKIVVGIHVDDLFTISKPEEKAKEPDPAAEDEGPGGFTYHHDYRGLFDRLSTRPTMWQRIKRGASNAMSSVKNFFGYGKKDTLADHIGVSRRDKSVHPLLDRMSQSNSLSSRMGRGASRAWASVKGFFGGRRAPEEEDDPASHIGDTIRRRTAPPKI
jgi:hypothetical protein